MEGSGCFFLQGCNSLFAVSLPHTQLKWFLLRRGSLHLSHLRRIRIDKYFDQKIIVKSSQVLLKAALFHLVGVKKGLSLMAACQKLSLVLAKTLTFSSKQKCLPIRKCRRCYLLN